jgi:hypothetical protein
MIQEMFDLGNKRWRAPSRDPTLGSINRDRAMLARVIHLQSKLAESSGRSQTLFIHRYEA